MENAYCVYMHTLKSDGRKYIGITKNSPKRRWQNGLGYKKNCYFWAAIKKYKWDSFKHEILFEKLTETQACNKEKALIKLFNTQDSKFGFNITEGGEHPKPTQVTRLKMSQHSKNKILLDEDLLVQKYIKEDLTIAQCAMYFNCTTPTISKNLNLHSIKKVPIQVPFDELHYQYVTLDKTQQECAEYFNCAKTTISRFLKNYNIKKGHTAKSSPEVIKKCVPYNKIEISKEQLYDVFIVQNKTIQETADYFSCSKSPIRRLLKEYNIEKPEEAKHLINSQKNIKYNITKDALVYQYIIVGMSRNDLAIYYNCGKTTIDRLLKKYNIKKI